MPPTVTRENLNSRDYQLTLAGLFHRLVCFIFNIIYSIEAYYTLLLSSYILKGISLYCDLRLEEGWENIFFSYYPLGCPFFIQDTQHLGAKERTGFLKTASSGKFYPMGKYFATRVHLDDLCAACAVKTNMV